jgi:6-phosphogluconolactonase
MNRFFFPTEAEFCENAARFILAKVEFFLSRDGLCSLILAGGTTPRPVYLRLGELLSQKKITPASLFFFLGDERPVPPHSPERNELMIRESLFRSFPPLQANVYFWDAPPHSPVVSARNYEKTIESFFTKNTRAPSITILGLGEDGHTASLFPGSEVENENGERSFLTTATPGNAFAVRIGATDTWRLSLSANFLRSSREIVFLVGGDNKETAFERLVDKDQEIPASWVVNKHTTVFVLGKAVQFASSDG